MRSDRNRGCGTRHDAGSTHQRGAARPLGVVRRRRLSKPAQRAARCGRSAGMRHALEARSRRSDRDKPARPPAPYAPVHGNSRNAGRCRGTTIDVSSACEWWEYRLPRTRTGKSIVSSHRRPRRTLFDRRWTRSTGRRRSCGARARVPDGTRRARVRRGRRRCDASVCAA